MQLSCKVLWDACCTSVVMEHAPGASYFGRWCPLYFLWSMSGWEREVTCSQGIHICLPNIDCPHRNMQGYQCSTYIIKKEGTVLMPLCLRIDIITFKTTIESCNTVSHAVSKCCTWLYIPTTIIWGLSRKGPIVILATTPLFWQTKAIFTSVSWYGPLPCS